MNTEQTNSEMPNPEQNTNVGIETTPIAENILTASTPVNVTQDDAVVPIDLSVDTNSTNVVAPEAFEVHSESDITTTQDSDWANKVRDVIRDDSGKPFKEEEDSEALQEAYMKSRFNVDLDSPEGK